MRRLPQLAQAAGFIYGDSEAYGYVQARHPDYSHSLFSRGIDAANAAGEARDGMTAGFKSKAARRVEEGCFYGAVLFVCLKTVKPDN